MVNIRPITEADAEDYLNLIIILDQETSFMLYEPDERKSTVEDMQSRIKQSVASGSLLLIAEDKGKVKGFISASRGHTGRIAHTAYIVVGILAESQGQGIGKMLFGEVDKWAMNSCVKRLELTVMEHNERAVRLYKSCGFKVEGLKEKSIRLDGVLVNEYYMAKIFE